MSQIEISTDKPEPYLNVKKLPYIKEIQTNISDDGKPVNYWAYFVIDKGAIYKDGDTYIKSDATSRITADRKFLRPKSFVRTITDENKIQNIEVRTGTLNEYLEFVNISKWRYPKRQQKVTFSDSGITFIDMKEEQTISRGTEKHELAPELWRYTPLVRTYWGYNKVYTLLDVVFQEGLIEECFFPSKSCNNLLLLLPEQHKNSKVMMSRQLSKQIEAGSRNYKGFEIKLYQEGNDRGIQVIIPDAKPASDKAPMQMDA